jgi:hypothetical protein
VEEEGKNLGDVFQEWTAWLGTAFSLVVLGAALIGLTLSLVSFVNMFRQVRERGADPTGGGFPLGHMFAVIVAGMISVSGVIYGLMSLVISPAGGG